MQAELRDHLFSATMGAAHSSVVPDRASPELLLDVKPIRPHGMTAHSKYIQLNNSYNALYDGIISLVRNNKYADLLVIYGDDRYPVHRAIVCPRSKFFEEECAVRDGERDYASPAKPTKIWIDASDCESHVLAAVLTFLYTLNYNASGPQALTFGLPEEVTQEDGNDLDSACELGPDDDELPAGSDLDNESVAFFTADEATPSQSSNSQPSTITLRDPSEKLNESVFHVQMYCAAHRFGITSLRQVAKEKLNRRLDSGAWKTEMVGLIREVYRQTDSGMLAGLRKDTVDWARFKFRTLKRCEGWDDLITEYPEFGAEILKRL